jgi:G3E family GTPase
MEDLDDDSEAPILVAVDEASEDDDDAPDLVATATASTAPLQQSIQHETATNDLPPCPVTILSGFLGAGKTTLIQYILQSPDHGKRIAVIENEFGDGLDVESLIARDGSDEAGNLQDLIELPNGCICCTVKDSLVSTLENLIEKKNDLDYILIEASGMANPGPIASVFWLDDALESRLRLDGIVTLVDSHHIERQVKETEEASQQIAYADRLLINKVDLLPEKKDIDRIIGLIRGIHPTAPIQATSFSKVPDLDWILDANCFGGQNRVEELDRFLREADNVVKSPPSEQQHHDHSHSHDYSEKHEEESCSICQEKIMSHRHTDQVSTIALRKEGSVDLGKINKWMAALLWPNQDEKDQVLTAMLQNEDSNEHTLIKSTQTSIYRIKGILSVTHDEMEPEFYKLGTLDKRRYIVQAVHDLWEVYPASDDLLWTEEETRECKLVVIGRRLDKENLEAGFFSCFVNPLVED